MTQHMLMKVVRYGRRMIGATSEAYWAATLWNAPHGIPGNLLASEVCKKLRILTAQYLASNKHLDVGREE
jgi:hypothetical protein